VTRLPACLLLDLDGVVADTEVLSLEAFADTYRDLGVPFSEEDVEAIVGLSFDRVDSLVRERYPVPLGHDELRTDYRARYVGRLEKGVEPNPGLRGLLIAAREQGVPVAVASSSPRYQVELVLSLTGMAPYVQAVAAGSEVANTKPVPDVYLLALERLGCTSEGAVAIEDSSAGVAAALAAGVPCVGLLTTLGPSAALPGASLVVGSLEELSLELLGEVAWAASAAGA
jgi:HAD superfamily hydrolase (TIGR01509 family)